MKILRKKCNFTYLGLAAALAAWYNNIDFIHCGILSKRIDLKFICSYETNGLKSHITSDDVDTIIVPMTSLNLFFADKQINERPTIIKINIGEGEKEALIGALHIIQRKNHS